MSDRKDNSSENFKKNFIRFTIGLSIIMIIMKLMSDNGVEMFTNCRPIIQKNKYDLYKVTDDYNNGTLTESTNLVRPNLTSMPYDRFVEQNV